MNVFQRYRRDIDAARLTIDALDWRSVDTGFGRIEYLDRGEGPEVLVVHGITQGADGGLRDLAEELVPDGYRVLVPSRFGYLGSAMPDHATPEMQADAFAEFIGVLDISDAVVVAGSAGSTSALHLCVRHPDPDVNRIELSQVLVPTLVMHARDDPGPPYASAVETAHRIPDAQLVTVDSGGHLMLGDHADAISEVARFIHEHGPSRAEGSQADQDTSR